MTAEHSHLCRIRTKHTDKICFIIYQYSSTRFGRFCYYHHGGLQERWWNTSAQTAYLKTVLCYREYLECCDKINFRLMLLKTDKIWVCLCLLVYTVYNKTRVLPTYVYTYIHLAVCLTTGPKPLPNRALHIVRSRASSFKCEYPLLSLRSSSSFLRLLPRLPVTSIPSFIFHSIARCRRQFLRKMWPIQLALPFTYFM